MQELALVVAGGGIAMFSGALMQLLIWRREHDSRKNTVRDAAFKEGVDACAEFVGASHLHLGRCLDLITALARLKAKYPHEERLALRLDPETLRTLVHPVIDRVLTASVRAEVLVATEAMAECIERMNQVHTAVAVLVRDGNDAKLPADWKRQVERLRTDHDRASTELVEQLRTVGANTTYRQLS